MRLIWNSLWRGVVSPERCDSRFYCITSVAKARHFTLNVPVPVPVPVPLPEKNRLSGDYKISIPVPNVDAGQDP